MSFTEEMISDSKEIWQDFYQHPFIQGMIDGTLDREKFCLYLIQDTNYLIDYVKVYAHAFLKARSVPIMRHIYGDMNMVHSEEDMMHLAYLRDFGYSEEDALAMPMLPGCRDYCNYMLRVAAEGSMQDAIVAAMPCCFSYYDIGVYCRDEAIRRGTYEHNFFRAWIDEYSSDGYKAIVDSSIALCDDFSASVASFKISSQRAMELSTMAL